MKFAIDHFNAETDDQSEWNLSGWAFVPGQSVTGARIELEGKQLSVAFYGSERNDVLAVHPSLCPDARVGLIAHVFLPPGLKPGTHHLHVVLLDGNGQELGRIPAVFELQHEIEAWSAVPPGPRVDANHPRAGYLDLLEKTLLGLPYAAGEEADLREDGRDWPQFAHSMIGRVRLHHLRACAETVLRENIPGDFMETGVWRGGACIMMRGVLRAHDITDRSVWVADSFKGLPPPDPTHYPADTGDILYTFKELAIPLGQVRENFLSYDLLDDQVKFLEGYFSETLPNAPVEKLAVLRLDGDMYESTMDALSALYPKLSPGGFCIIDDYGGIPACRQAVRDYRKAHGITEPISMIDWTGVWWRKEDAGRVETVSSNEAPTVRQPRTDTQIPRAGNSALSNLVGFSLGNLVFTQPTRLAPSAWLEHLPFGYWLVEQMRPGRVVELGVHFGTSYCAFCQAVAALRLDAHCVGIDTFQGDSHTESYGPEVLAELRAHHDPLYGHFSELVQSTFDAALVRFDEHSIDLLHIDGAHTYEEVKHDFESWRSRLSRRGVVLFHDTQVKDHDFGVWRLWQELSRDFPSFEFHHGHGLGILAVGDEPAPAIKALVESPEPGRSAVRRLFATLGHRMALLAAEGNGSKSQDEAPAANAEIALLQRKLEALAAQQIRVQEAFMKFADRPPES